MLLMVVRSVLDLLQSSLHWVLQSVKNTLWKALVVLFIVLTLLWLSAFMYGTFYYAYMPVVSVSKPVHFQFSVCDSEKGSSSLCSYPTANVSFTENEILMRGQQYRVTLRLEIPESHVNEKIGMFMVTLRLYDRQSRVVSSSSRATMLRYRSPLLQTLHTLAFSALYLSGMEEQTQNIDVELFTQYMDDPLNPAAGAVMEIRNKKIQFYTAHLNIHAYFTGLRYIMYHWPVLSALVGTGCNLATLAALALLSWYRYSIYRQPANTSAISDADDEPLTLDERRRMIRARLDQEQLDEQVTQPANLPPDIPPADTSSPSEGAPEDNASIPQTQDTEVDKLLTEDSAPDPNTTAVSEETNVDAQFTDHTESQLRQRHPVTSEE